MYSQITDHSIRSNTSQLDTGIGRVPKVQVEGLCLRLEIKFNNKTKDEVKIENSTLKTLIHHPKKSEEIFQHNPGAEAAWETWNEIRVQLSTHRIDLDHENNFSEIIIKKDFHRSSNFVTKITENKFVGKRRTRSFHQSTPSSYQQLDGDMQQLKQTLAIPERQRNANFRPVNKKSRNLPSLLPQIDGHPKAGNFRTSNQNSFFSKNAKYTKIELKWFKSLEQEDWLCTCTKSISPQKNKLRGVLRIYSLSFEKHIQQRQQETEIKPSYLASQKWNYINCVTLCNELRRCFRSLTLKKTSSSLSTKRCHRTEHQANSFFNLPWERDVKTIRQPNGNRPETQLACFVQLPTLICKRRSI